MVQRKTNTYYFVVLALTVLIAGGYLAWDYLGVQKEQFQRSASIERLSNAQKLLLKGPVSPVIATRLDIAKVKLGEMLFYDPRLSGSGEKSCAVCHGFTREEIGQSNESGFNTGTIFNVALNGLHGWLGQNISLNAYTDSLIEDPKHMQASWAQVIDRLQSDEQYQKLFSASYPGGLSRVAITDALVVFEKSMITPNARFDQFLNGDSSAISEDERAGYYLFASYGCIACHQGVNFGGNVFSKLGLFHEYPFARNTDADEGLKAITGKADDAHVFRVPGLRNVATTAPYFHDGSVASLDQAVRDMAMYQGGRKIPDSDVTLIVLFLSTLTGEYQGQSL